MADAEYIPITRKAVSRRPRVRINITNSAIAIESPIDLKPHEAIFWRYGDEGQEIYLVNAQRFCKLRLNLIPEA